MWSAPRLQAPPGGQAEYAQCAGFTPIGTLQGRQHHTPSAGEETGSEALGKRPRPPAWSLAEPPTETVRLQCVPGVWAWAGQAGDCRVGSGGNATPKDPSSQPRAVHLGQVAEGLGASPSSVLGARGAEGLGETEAAVRRKKGLAVRTGPARGLVAARGRPVGRPAPPPAGPLPSSPLQAPFAASTRLPPICACPCSSPGMGPAPRPSLPLSS